MPTLPTLSAPTMKRANGVDDVDGNPAKKRCVSERAGRAPGPLATLLGAIRDGDEAQVEAALRDGASVDSTITLAKDEFKNMVAGPTSVLILAIAQGHNGIVKLLLERGADVHWARPHNGATPAFIAAENGQTVEVEALIANKADPERIAQRTRQLAEDIRRSINS